MAAGNESRSAWRVEFNQDTCSICEMCVNRCPTNALTIRRTGKIEDILFDSLLCDACGGDVYCQTHCPEKAVTVTKIPIDTVPDAPVVLISGEMAACQDCGALFMPERRLQTLLTQQKITPKSVQSFCPNCRREHLMDSYLDLTKLG